MADQVFLWFLVGMFVKNSILSKKQNMVQFRPVTGADNVTHTTKSRLMYSRKGP